jgi:hypothetical protein
MRYLLGTTAIAAALLLSAPAFAQQSYYDTNPTPAEKAQTNQLNNDARDNADADDQDDAAPAPSQNQRDYDAKKAEYDNKMDQYNAQSDQYARDRARYHADRADYAHNWAVFYGYRDFRDVNDMSSGELMGLRVSAHDGVNIGRIRDVNRAPNGAIVRVAIRLDDGGVAWVDSDDLRFSPSTRHVMTDLSRGQIDDMSRMHTPRY